MSVPGTPSHATESVQAAVGIVTAFLDQLSGKGMTGKQYLQHTAAEIARVGALSITDSLVMLTTSLLLPLAAHHEQTPEQLLQQIAMTVASGGSSEGA